MSNSWAVQLVSEGGQMDGPAPVITYHLIDDLVQLDELIHHRGVREIHLVRTQSEATARIVFEQAQRRTQ